MTSKYSIPNKISPPRPFREAQFSLCNSKKILHHKYNFEQLWVGNLYSNVIYQFESNFLDIAPQCHLISTQQFKKTSARFDY